jgi:hypothetical protein
MEEKHMKFRDLWMLQIFADDPEGDPDTKPEGNPNEGGDPEGGQEGKPKGKPAGKTYTDAEVDEIIKNRLSRANAEKDKAIKAAKEEAEKLAKMNEEQKAQYRYEKLEQESAAKDAEIERLKGEAFKTELGKSASQIMKDEHGIIATPEMLEFVVGKDAEETKGRIDKLIGIILDDRKAQEEKRATGRTPRSYSGGGKQLTEIEKRIAKYR